MIRHIMWREKLYLSISIKGRFFKNVLDKINSSKNLQKLPHQFPAVREGSFCKFLDELILSGTFFKKTDFNMSFPVSFIRLVAGNLTINHKKYLIYLKTSASQACGESISFWNKSPIVLITTAQRAGKLFYTLVSFRTSVCLEKV